MKGTIIIMSKKEIWKEIKDYEGLYQISNLGNVKGIDRIRKSCYNSKAFKKGVELNLKQDKDGYLICCLTKNSKSKYKKAHRLVLSAFIGDSDLQCNHKDGNKKNNNVDNLEYVTAKENVIHAIKLGLKNNNYNISKRIPVYQYDKKGNFIKQYESIMKAGILNNFDYRQISLCLKNKRKSAYNFIWRKLYV